MTRLAITALASAWLLAGCFGSSSTKEEDLAGQWIHVSEGYLRLDYSMTRPGYFVMSFEDLAIIYRVDDFAEEEEAFVLHLSDPMLLEDPDSGLRFLDRAATDDDMANVTLRGRVVNGFLTSTYLELYEFDDTGDRQFQRADWLAAMAILADNAVREYRTMDERNHGGP